MPVSVYFSRYFNTAATCTGPTGVNIHGKDEYVEVPSVTQVAQILAMATLARCQYEV